MPKHAFAIFLAAIWLCAGLWMSAQEPTAAEWYHKALRFIKEGEKAQALAAYNRSVALDSTEAIVWANRGTLLLNMQRYKEALESYERSLALRPGSAYVYCSRATLFNRTKRPELALRSADKALKCDSLHWGALLNKAKALETLGRPEEAEACRARALEFKPALRHRPTLSR